MLCRTIKTCAFKKRNIFSFFPLLPQIRGVASKQLVNDGVLEVPARFVSYQQVVCPLPELSIHNPDQVTNFDLKENTDHTR